MDCGTFTIQQTLGGFLDIYMERFVNKFISSRIFPKSSLLPKIGIVLLAFSHDVIIIHEGLYLFKNINNKGELSMVNEYKDWLKIFEKEGGSILFSPMSASLVIEYLDKGYKVIATVKKEGGGSHLISIIDHLKENIVISDNKKGTYNINKSELDFLLNIENGSYILICK